MYNILDRSVKKKGLHLLSTRSWSFFTRSREKKWIHDNVIFRSVYDGQLRLCMSYLLCATVNIS
jgi:hypothetical protein